MDDPKNWIELYKELPFYIMVTMCILFFLARLPKNLESIKQFIIFFKGGNTEPQKQVENSKACCVEIYKLLEDMKAINKEYMQSITSITHEFSREFEEIQKDLIEIRAILKN